MNKPGGFNATNLHTHGLHVRPEYPSRCEGKESSCDAVADNVLIEVVPGKSQKYEIEIPKTHPPGTHWYHAHKHGSVAMQMGGGMAGALIIEGGLDDVPEIKKAKEEVLVFQQLSLSRCGRKELTSNGPLPPEGALECMTKPGTSFETCDDYYQRLASENKQFTPPSKGVLCMESFDASFGPQAWSTFLVPRYGDRTSVNGKLVPGYHVKQGELLRWRMVDAGIRNTIMLGLVPKPKLDLEKGPKALLEGAKERLAFHVIAYDGIATGRIDKTDAIELQPGYRADALLRFDEPGDYALIDLETPAALSLRPADEPFGVLATVHVDPADGKMDFPSAASLAKLAPYKHVEDKEIKGCQYNVFKIDTSTTPARFMVNGQSFDPSKPRTVPLGNAEEWVVSSELANHPYHIHVNPFEIQEAYGRFPAGTWKDTLLVMGPSQVPPKPAQPVKIRTRYEDFSGKFVLHCHILDHEDQGMMQMVEVLPKGQKASSCPTLCTNCKKGEQICQSPPPSDGTCPAPPKK